MRNFAAICLVFLFVGTVIAASSVDYENSPQSEEVYRIKIWNLPGGTIEVSSDQGKNWEPVGKVVYPTQKTNPESYAASAWVDDGKIAATAVNAIHIKASTDAKTGRGIIFSLLPREFQRPPKVYRSYLSPDSSVYTDIPAGDSIFGGGSAPFVGNAVMVSRGGQAVTVLPDDYVPQVGDRIYILVERPVDYPKEMVFENRFGGAVTIKYFGGEEKVIGEVLRPVVGVGRFEGSKHSSVGRIRANHAGVIDVSTSMLGKIGGFQIVPSMHGTGMEYVKASTQYMVIGPPAIEEASLEGRAPFFKYFIQPAYGENDLEAENWDQKLLGRFLVDVKLKGRDKWQAMPVREFDEYYLTGDVPSWANTALQQVTDIRILFPIEKN